MNPELAAFLQRQMWLTDDELTAIARDPEQLKALLDVVLNDTSPSPGGHAVFNAGS